MATVIPFCGLRYNPKKVRDLSLVMAPPYDVISPAEQESYYQLHPHNIIRLILAKKHPTDTEGSNCYTRAAADFSTWRKESILIKDSEPCFYFYRQEFALFDDNKAVRDGFIALVRLEDFERGAILPHEKTLSKPKEDRLHLIRACRANFSCVFSLYQDPSQQILPLLHKAVSGEPYLNMTDREGCRHTLWRVVGNNIAQKISATLNNAKLFIADGHHRYETALNFSKEMQKAFPNAGADAPFNYLMMYLTPMESSGLFIFPYHRAIHSLTGFESSQLETNLQKYFHIETLPYPGAGKGQTKKTFAQHLQAMGAMGVTFGIVVKGLPCLLIASLKDGVLPDNTAPVDALDVSILERYVFNDLLAIDSKNLREQNNIVYFHNMDESFALVENEGYQLAIILNPTKIEDLKRVVSSGEKMPQKSTYFYPKVLSGPAINSIDPED